MSGPKLMHITNDPKVIQRINNRLNTIGKENYFSSQIQSINIDIQNEMIWIKNYVNETMNNTISISKTHSKRKKKIYSTGFGRNADISMGFYEQHGRKVMHIDS